MNLFFIISEFLLRFFSNELIFIVALSSFIENIPAQEAGDCNSTLSIVLCDGNAVPELSRLEQTRFHTNYIRGQLCPGGELQFDWEITANDETTNKAGAPDVFSDYINRETFILKRHVYGTGKYTIKVFEKIDGSRKASSKCDFRIISETPIPFIMGGTERTVASDKPIILIGHRSIDRNMDKEITGLEFKWKCLIGSKNYCHNLKIDEPDLTIPKELATAGITYNITLKVKTKDSNDSKWVKTWQQIIVESNPTVLEITCLKNCPPINLLSNSKEITILKVQCLNNCKNTNDFNWVVDAGSFDYHKNTRGRHTDTFTIKENVFYPGDQYRVIATHSASGASIKQYITPHVPPTLKDCQINPKSGTAFTTNFVAECTFSCEGPHKFKIYSLGSNTATLVSFGQSLPSMKFVLGPTTKVKIKLVDNFQFSASRKVDVSVTPGIFTTLTPEEIEQYINNEFYNKSSKNSLENLLDAKKYTVLLQHLNSITDILSSIPMDETDMMEFQTKNLEFLQEVPVDSLEFAEKVSDVASKIASQQTDSSDPDFARLTTDLCVKGSKNYNSLLKQERYASSFSESAETMAQTTTNCSQAGTKPNKGFLKEYNLMYNETESHDTSDVEDVQVITENYPDYIDESDPKYKTIRKKTESYAKATENLVVLCYSTSKTLSLVMIPEEPTKYTQWEAFQVTATKVRGSVTHYPISSQDVNLIPSNDLETYNEEISIALCTSKTNPFWWDVNQPATITNIAMLRFETEEDIVKKFRSPFSINFELEKEFQPNVFHEGTSPQTWNYTTSKEEEEFERIGIYKINVLSKRGFSVEFINLTEDCSLKVFVSHLEKVSTIEFHRKSIVITNTSNILYTEHSLDYDSWYYLHVLPDKNMENEEVTFQFSVYSFFCIQWSTANRNWTFACQGSSKSSRSSIECLCYHSSVLMGQVSYNKVTEERTLPIEHVLDIRVNYTIFASVVVIFFIYCILMCFFASDDKILKQPVYFLGDVPSTYRYGYLVIVKTGNKRTAGTTSNVIIKIYGNKSASKEHLLNYPDPEKRILQSNGEDWFILGTPEYLGDIQQLEVMFDSVGPRPSWYCSEIEIIDLQENNYWLFLLDFQFEISIKENYFYTAVPVNKDDAKKKKMRNAWHKKIRNAFHGQHMWNIITYEDPYIPKVERLTIMLSIFLTTYTITLFLYGCPHLINSDILEPYIEFSFYPKVFLISFIALMITFVIHCPLVFCLKLWRKRQKRNCITMAWYFVATLIVSSMTILIIFGFWLPYFTSLLWLTSVIITLLVYIFLFENFNNLLNQLTTTQAERVDYIFQTLQTVVTYVEMQRNMLYANFGPKGLRSYFSHLYTPMDESVIKEKKHFALIQSQVIEILGDIVMISLYVFLLYILVLSDRHPMTYLNHAEVQELIKGTHVRKIGFETISSLEQIESYLIQVLIPTLQSSHWYGRYYQKNPGLTVDNSNKYVGVVRLRQHRTYNITCVIPEFMQFLNVTCKPDFKVAPEDKNFSEEWKPDNIRNLRMDYVWKFQTALDTATLPYLGEFAIYPGGGYTALLGRYMENSMVNAKYLIRTLWIDSLTRIIFIEFLLYSPNSNLFNSVEIRFEINPTGYIVQNFDVHTAQLVYVQEEEGGFLLETIIGSFILILVFLVIKIIYKVSRVKRIYFKDAMRILDIILIILSIIYLFLYLNRTRLVIEFLDKVQVAQHNEFISYFHLFYAETVFKLLAALLVFLATFRLWKLLRFLVIIKIFEKTLTLLIAPLFSVVIYQITMTFSFAIAGTILFGDQSLDFVAVGHSYITLMTLSLGLFDFNFKLFASHIHFIYYTCYMLFTLLIYNLYVTIITISYGDAQQHYSDLEEYTVVDYLKEQFWYFSTILKIKFKKKKRMRAGGDEYEEELPVVPKSDEHRYADCHTTPSNRMKTMTYIALNLLRKAKEPSKSKKNIDEDLIKNLIVNMFMHDSDKKEIFYLNNDDKNKTPFVDDLTFVKMEKIVNMLCGEDERQNNERLEEMYRKINKNQTDRMERIDQDLKVLLNTVNKIKFQ